MGIPQGIDPEFPLTGINWEWKHKSCPDLILTFCRFLLYNIYHPRLIYMRNPAKTILLLILLLIIVIVFFALTGIDLRKPEQATYKLMDKVMELNRAINRMVRTLIFSIRGWFQETFSR